MQRREAGICVNTSSTPLESFSSPFHKDYWRCAAAEFTNPRTIIIAAMITALRIILKSISIPIAPSLNITFGFYANALGSMIYGPLVGLASGAISDTLGAFLFPKGLYFFPFIITEMAGSFIYGLFLYRAKLSVGRVVLSKFSVSMICNLLLTPILMKWYHAYFATESTYKFFTLIRALKNIALFLPEAFLLVLFLFAIMPITSRIKLTPQTDAKPEFTRRNIIAVIILLLVSIAAVCFLVYLLHQK